MTGRHLAVSTTLAGALALGSWGPLPARAAGPPPIQMGMRASVFQPPGTRQSVLLYGIYVQYAFDEHWSAMVEVLYANWSDSRGDHRWTNVPVSGVYQFLPGRAFNPYGMVGLGYSAQTDTTGGVRSSRALTGGHLGVGFVFSGYGLGFSLEGRYVIPRISDPRTGYVTWGGGMSLGFGMMF